LKTGEMPEMPEKSIKCKSCLLILAATQNKKVHDKDRSITNKIVPI
jgi:hypothetical protein